MKIVSLKLQNYMRLSAEFIDAQCRSVIIRSKNTGGKTTVIDSIYDCFLGISNKDHPQPIHAGEEKGEIEIDIGDYLITRKFTQNSPPSLVVKAKDGTKIKSPQQLLNTLIDENSLEIGLFLQAKDQDKIDMIMKVAPIPMPYQQVKQITGEDIPPRPEETPDQYLMRLSADNVGYFYDLRRLAHVEATRVEGSITKQKERVETLQGLVKSAGVETVEEIKTKLDEVRTVQERYHAFQMELSALETRKTSYQTTLNTISAEVESKNKEKESLTTRLNDARKLVIQLEAEIAVNNGKTDELIQRGAKGEKAIADVVKQIAECKSDNSHITDMSEELDGYERRLVEISGKNESKIKLDSAMEQLENLSREYAVATANHKRYDVIVSDLRLLRRTILENIDVGVKGLSITEGKILLNNIPFVQASNRERMEVAAAIAMLRKPKVKILTIDNGEAFDTESRDYLIELAHKHDWQVFMTCVSDDPEIKLEFVANAHEAE